MFHAGDHGIPEKADKKLLDFLVDEGFSFVRIPLSYWFWVEDFKYDSPRQDRLDMIDSYVQACTERGLHLSLNIHRAPGYCINGAELEKHNLWKDIEAQDAFTAMWRNFARRFQSYSPEALSFDLLNEPPNIDQYGMTRDIHKNLMLRVIAAIRKVSPLRPITLDGLGGGNIAMPELKESGCIHSTRGYQPMPVTHYQADWCNETRGLPLQDYPGTEYAGVRWNKARIREHFEPWVQLSRQGVPVHVGEMGCYDRIPNDTALRWFSDLFEVLRELGWGFGLWEFKGPFGVCGHHRPGTKWEKRGPYKVDSHLWGMIKESRDYLENQSFSDISS